MGRIRRILRKADEELLLNGFGAIHTRQLYDFNDPVQANQRLYRLTEVLGGKKCVEGNPDVMCELLIRTNMIHVRCS